MAGLKFVTPAAKSWNGSALSSSPPNLTVAVTASRDDPPSPVSSILRELFAAVVLAVILDFGISFAVQTVHAEGLSMFARLDNNDYLMANKVDYTRHPPQRGGIVILPPASLIRT